MENADKLVFDLASEVDNSPASPFISKQWLQVIDDNSTNYASSNCVISTAVLSNSNKFINYREASLFVPLLITVTTNQVAGFSPATANTGAAYAVGLKNWFGSLIHSIAITYNGQQIVQQTGFQSVLNSFKLMTTLSYQDILTQGCSLSFVPDDPTAWSYHLAAGDLDGQGVCNNRNLASTTAASFGAATNFNSYNAFVGNSGFRKRQTMINFDCDGGADLPYSSFYSANNANSFYKSRVIRKVNSAAGTNGCLQIACGATIMLRHLSNLFSSMPLIRGAYLTMTLQLNNSTTVVTKSAAVAAVVANPAAQPPVVAVAAVAAATTLTSVNCAVGGDQSTVNGQHAAWEWGGSLQHNSRKCTNHHHFRFDRIAVSGDVPACSRSHDGSDRKQHYA